MNLDIEGGDEWLPGDHQRKLFQIELRGLAKIGHGLFDRVALRGGAGLGVECGEPSLCGRHKNSGEQHFQHLGIAGKSVYALALHRMPWIETHGKLLINLDIEGGDERLARHHQRVLRG
jgi:hypothetical protein